MIYDCPPAKAIGAIGMREDTMADIILLVEDQMAGCLLESMVRKVNCQKNEFNYLDIRLLERSVSERHASISIKQMSSTHRLIASIRDIGSKNGIYLNEEELDYENHSCKANDIITIGKCYKLILLLVDAEQLGLSVAEDFVAVEDDSFQPHVSRNYSAMGNPYSASERKVETGTVDLSGDQFEEPGKTNFL